MLGIELEGGMAAREGIARALMVNPRNADELGRMLFVRYRVQGIIERTTQQAAELLGAWPLSRLPRSAICCRRRAP